MKSTFHATLSISLNVMAYDKADAWELLNAWADAVRGKDGEGLQHLDAVTQVRPVLALKDVVPLSKPPAEPEAVHVINPVLQKSTRFVAPGHEPRRGKT